MLIEAKDSCPGILEEQVDELRAVSIANVYEDWPGLLKRSTENMEHEDESGDISVSRANININEKELVYHILISS